MEEQLGVLTSTALHIVTGAPRVLRLMEIEHEIARGAEAYIYKGKFLGTPCVVKMRVSKSYRHPKLDRVIIRNRTVKEARIMITAKKSGINVPSILFIEPRIGILVMEYVEGELLRNLLPKLSESELARYVVTLGRYAALLHKQGICHGDLTTSNVVVGDEEIYLIDFGLADYTSELEDFGVDVHLFLRSIESTAWSRAQFAYEKFLQGYAEILGREFAEKIREKVHEIRLRGRYVEERRLKRCEVRTPIRD